MKLAGDLAPEELGAREKIIEAATVLFAKDGLHGVSTRDIARESGLNLSLISYYFGGKESLYRTIMQEFGQRLFQTMNTFMREFETQAVSEKSIRQLVDGLIDNLIDQRIAHPDVARILTREKLTGLPYSREIQEKIFNDIGQKLHAVFAKGQKAGIISKKINIHFVLVCLVESILAYFNMLDCQTSWCEHCYSLPEDRKELKEQLSRLFLEGILK